MNIQYLYQKIYKEFFKKYNIDTFAADDFSDSPPYYLIKSVHPLKKTSMPRGCAIFLDQEPVYPNLHTWIYKTSDELLYDDASIWEKRLPVHSYSQCIFVGEKSEEVEFLKSKLDMFQSDVPVVYYFYHALASLDNYRNYWKDNIEIPTTHDKLFICYQNVINSYRWHRIQFQLRLKETGLIDKGLVSYNPTGDLADIIKTATLRHNNTPMELYALHNLDLLKEPSHIDDESPNGAMSTFIDIENCQRAFVHVVSETCFHNGKKHLTEKIFKPIIAMQPFLLLGAYKNLEYFKEYGFKTFNDFWDEGYDSISNDVDRIDAVFKILQTLDELSYEQQCQMRKDMTPIIEHNAYNFYYKLKNKVVNELTTNIKIEMSKSQRWNYIKDSDIAHLNQILRF